MRRLSLLAVALLSVAGASAGEVVIYRCVGADGSVTLQNGVRCPKGSRETRRVIDNPVSTQVPVPEVPAVPVAVAASAEPEPAPVPPPAGPTDMEALPAPAPALFACATARGERYFGDAAGSRRCLPLRTVGLDGNDATDASACEVVVVSCEPVAEDARCAAWAERRRLAESALLFASAEPDAARAELIRIDHAVDGTVCAASRPSS